MQAIFFAHGPFAKSLKDAARKRNSAKRKWVSTEPHIMESELLRCILEMNADDRFFKS